MRKRKFKVCFVRPETGRDSIMEFDPSFDQNPSSGEYVNSLEAAIRYFNEVFGYKEGEILGYIFPKKS